MKKILLIFFAACIWNGCGTFDQAYLSDDYLQWEQKKPHSNKEVIHTLYLVGDTGEIDDYNNKTNLVLEAMKKELANEKSETSLVFLGDNIYPHGMPSKKSEERGGAEDIIKSQLECAKAHDGDTYFIPGNHDWNKHKPGGRKSIKRQEEFINDYFGKKDKSVHFYPKDACADPKVVKINKDLVYVFIDSQWWLQNWTHEKKMNHGCEIKSRVDLLKSMQEILIEHKNDEIVVMMHHPILSDGLHGGNFSPKHHLFPLTEIKNSLWVPLPIIGSLYPFYRKITGSKQDIPHELNKDLMQELNKMAKALRIHVVFASGHDHGLQYFEDDKLKYIVSGAGGKVDYIKKGGKAEYARSARGYVKVNFHEDFEAWAEYYVIDDNGLNSKLEFRVQLRAPRAGTIEEEIKYPSIGKETKLIAANKKLAAGPIKKLFLGGQYRDMWATPVTAEVIDLETKLGGLTPIKKGGGMASNSLRMEKENEQQYILRSIKKDYTKLVPPDFTNLKLIDVLADQNSASHPYNALIIPSLSKSAGIFYTTPKLVYLKHQKGLGNYNSQFPEELYLLEERPSGNWSNNPSFGNSENIVGYVDLLEILRIKKNHFVDQKWVLKSRMFDMFIHDWDRHDDQWRWASFEENDKHVYRPIPRDRDQAFYRFKGIIPWYVSAFMMKKFKTIKEDCKDVKSLGDNGKHFDRYFINELEWEDWESVITQMQADLTDSEIDKAIQGFPKEIMELEFDEELSHLLKARRTNLLKIGRRLYDVLAKEVEITGSDNNDDFEITRNGDGSVRVIVSLKSKEHGELTKFDRTFYPDETKELRLYGLRGKDDFVVKGSSNDKIKIRIIGGEDDDEIKNKGEGAKLFAYDEPKGIKLKGAVINKTSNELEVNEYDRNEYTNNTNLPIVTFGNSVDDGWWFGGAISWTNQGWRKDPYKSRQSVNFSIAPGSRDAYLLGYSGHFPEAIANLDFTPAFNIEFPHYENYFGLGNNSSYDPSTSIQYNWVRMQDIDINPRLRANLGKSSFLEFGPLFQYRNIKAQEGRVSNDPILGFSNLDLESRNYLGADLNFSLGFADSNVFPTNGFRLMLGASQLIEPSKEENVTLLTSNAKFYFRLVNRPKVVFATQAGFEKSYGDLQFYHFSDLGNSHGLRGFRNERFRGDAAFYNNLDLRIKLIKWDNNIVPMDIGLLGGYDYGKVFYSGIEANRWHDSRTVGVWFELLGAMVIQPYYSFNDEQNTFSLKLGFNY